MKTTRRDFLQASALASLAASQQMASVPALAQSIETTPATEKLDGYKLAARHTIRREIPGPTFFEGMLLGNGDVGVCALVRPDALGLHFGKNDCWDIRVSEDIAEHVLPFAEVLKLWQRASEEAKRQGKPDMLYLESGIDFFNDYSKRVGTSYSNKWPRPWPCGTVWLNWDPRWVAPGQYTLNPANGTFTLELKCTNPGIDSRNSDADGGSRSIQLTCFVDWATGLVSVSTNGSVPLLSLVYSPEIDGFHGGPFDRGHVDVKPELLPKPETAAKTGDDFAEFSCFQYLPSIGPTRELPSPPKSDKDRNFSLHGRIAGRWSVTSAKPSTDVTLASIGEQAIHLDVLLVTPRDLYLKRLEEQASAGKRWVSVPQNHAFSAEDLDTAAHAQTQVARLSGTEFTDRQQDSEKHWREHWSRSAVELKDKDLERIWYHNQYFLACCLRKHKVAPGLFANWSAGDIGTAWHGDYHLDYNCQQVYWGVFSSNHVDQHLPYVEMCENLTPIAEKFAKENFNLPGAFFPVSAYPVPSQIVPYPVPPWAYQISMTPWIVQSLWWQYLYTQDDEYLRHVYPILRSAARFVAAFVKRGDDQLYHFIPTVSSENWGFTVDYRLNKDCILDIALTRFLLSAVIEGSTVMGIDEEERAQWRNIYRNLASYPKANGPYGEVWLDIMNGPIEHIFNVPITLAPVFPGEQVGIGQESPEWEIANRTAHTLRLEGGNDLVYQPLIRARLGMLDLDWFKREVLYCTLPNGIANDRVRQSGGRYSQSVDFDFMMRMGVWCENFALPAVLNECMMQSYTGTIRLFPNATNMGPARFESLRAAGAFLVSAVYDGRTVTHLSLLSEKGKTVRMSAPWKEKRIRVTRIRDRGAVAVWSDGEEFRFETEPDTSYLIEPK